MIFSPLKLQYLIKLNVKRKVPNIKSMQENLVNSTRQEDETTCRFSEDVRVFICDVF